MMPFYREFLSSSMIRFVLLLGLASLILAMVNLDGVRTIIALLGGAVFFAVAEYVAHCFLLHKFPKLIPPLYQGHAKHHEHPKEFNYLFSPMWYDALLYVGYFVLLWAVFRDLSLIIPIIAGTSLYQINYQWMHYISHRPVTPITAWGKWLKKKHLLHHYQDEHSWFGVSHPALDYVFGTHKPRASKASRHAEQHSA